MAHIKRNLPDVLSIRFIYKHEYSNGFSKTISVEKHFDYVQNNVIAYIK